MLKLVWIALISVVAVACAGNPPPPAEEAAHGAPSSAPLVPAGEAKLGDKTKCPVSGEEFVVKADSPKAEYGGKTYYFCCAHCVEKFQQNPQKYTTGS